MFYSLESVIHIWPSQGPSWVIMYFSVCCFSVCTPTATWVYPRCYGVFFAGYPKIHPCVVDHASTADVNTFFAMFFCYRYRVN